MTINDPQRLHPRAGQRPLTPRQRAFAQRLAHGGTAGQAALAAGYGDASHGSRCLRDPRVMALVEQYRADLLGGLADQLRSGLALAVEVVVDELRESRDPDLALAAVRALGGASVVAVAERADRDPVGPARATARLDAEIEALLAAAAAHHPDAR